VIIVETAALIVEPVQSVIVKKEEERAGNVRLYKFDTAGKQLQNGIVLRGSLVPVDN